MYEKFWKFYRGFLARCGYFLQISITLDKYIFSHEILSKIDRFKQKVDSNYMSLTGWLIWWLLRCISGGIIKQKIIFTYRTYFKSYFRACVWLCGDTIVYIRCECWLLWNKYDENINLRYAKTMFNGQEFMLYLGLLLKYYGLEPWL